MLKGRHIKTLIAFFTALYLLGYSLASAYPVENSRQHRDDHSSEIVFISEAAPASIVYLHKLIITVHALADTVPMPAPSIKSRKGFSATIQIFLQNKYPRWSSSTFL
ncbi:MAG: hypothetical protein CVV44_19505 [Spirochaetae bacterium HGW-Spirochaetae-1]|jgi:hypothetical protein|nr:MAG: hypothetical protein CVV44_19505 [Spirochaetae bacterium HGW-Spirochaetae-1]